jgi:hypothetical protein
MLFHPMKWQSEEHVGLTEAAEWARHFATLEGDMDRLLVDMFGRGEQEIADWIVAGRYISGRELAEHGLAEMVELEMLRQFRTPTANPRLALRTVKRPPAARNTTPRAGFKPIRKPRP